MPLSPEAKQLRDLRKSGKESVVALEVLITQLDTSFSLPAGPDREKSIAALTSKLEYAKDCLKHFGLGLALDKPAKKQSLK